MLRWCKHFAWTNFVDHKIISLHENLLEQRLVFTARLQENPVVGTSFGQIPSKDYKKILWWGRVLKHFTKRPQENLLVGVRIHHKTKRPKEIFWWSRVRKSYTTRPQENLLVGVGFRKFHHKTTRKSGGGGNSSEIFTTRTQENLVVGVGLANI